MEVVVEHAHAGHDVSSDWQPLFWVLPFQAPWLCRESRDVAVCKLLRQMCLLVLTRRAKGRLVWQASPPCPLLHSRPRLLLQYL